MQKKNEGIPNELTQQELDLIREEAEKEYPLPDDRLRGTHSYKLAANQIQSLRDAYFDGQVAALTRERLRSKELVEALEKILPYRHGDRSISLEAQGYNEVECADIGTKDYLAGIAEIAETALNNYQKHQ